MFVQPDLLEGIGFQENRISGHVPSLTIVILSVVGSAIFSFYRAEPFPPGQMEASRALPPSFRIGHMARVSQAAEFIG